MALFADFQHKPSQLFPSQVLANVEISAVLFSIIVMHASLSNTESGRRVLDSSNHHADSTFHIFPGGYLHSDNWALEKTQNLNLWQAPGQNGLCATRAWYGQGCRPWRASQTAAVTRNSACRPSVSHRPFKFKMRGASRKKISIKKKIAIKEDDWDCCPRSGFRLVRLQVC